MCVCFIGCLLLCFYICFFVCSYHLKMYMRWFSLGDTSFSLPQNPENNRYIYIYIYICIVCIYICTHTQIITITATIMIWEISAAHIFNLICFLKTSTCFCPKIWIEVIFHWICDILAIHFVILCGLWMWTILSSKTIYYPYLGRYFPL